ncbi:hypothetical protein B0H10DRAFT_2232389 [Mycena sp. CBHHK59/15]|nr:hypothetical protein B0H10DRAFT_2232389 [Mycena sp. CBHHK59/15]
MPSMPFDLQKGERYEDGDRLLLFSLIIGLYGNFRLKNNSNAAAAVALDEDDEMPDLEPVEVMYPSHICYCDVNLSKICCCDVKSRAVKAKL